MEDSKLEMINTKLDELDWGDETIPELMESFFNSPGEAVEKEMDKCSEDHLEHLWTLLECDENLDEEE